MATARSRVVVAVGVATLFGVALFLLSTVGVRALRSTEADRSSTPARVPEFLHSPPESVPTTTDYGPVGPVSVVFAGSRVITGLADEVENPWIAVSSETGEYRALMAPHRPEPAPDAVAVSPDGTALAWGFDGGVVLYDPVEDEAREVHTVDGDPLVGQFSPDGSRLAVFDGALRVVDAGSGEVAATLTGVDQRAARQAVWTPDGTALTYVAGGRLVTHAWQSDDLRATPAPIAPDATLSWQPSGEQLAAMEESRGVKSVEVFDVAPNGRLTPVRTVAPDTYAQQELLGFTTDTRVTVTALRLETGTLPFVYTMSTVDASPPSQVMQIDGSGTDWDTLQVAAEPLARGSQDFPEPRWPARDLAKLVGSALLALLALGLYLTRRPRKNRRLRRIGHPADV